MFKFSWVSSTYNVPLDEDLPHSETDRKVKMLKYYQWTPFILLLQALLFYIPRMIWRSLNDKSGLDLQGMVTAVYDYQKDVAKFADRKNFLNYLTNSFDHYVSSVTKENKNLPTRRHRNVYDGENSENLTNLTTDQEENDDDYEMNKTEIRKNKVKGFIGSIKKFFRVLCVTKGKRYGNYLMVLFVFCRVLFTLNSIMQLFILNHFLGNDYLLLGFEGLISLNLINFYINNILLILKY